MGTVSELLILLIILSDFYLISAGPIRGRIKYSALQGVMAAVLPLLSEGGFSNALLFSCTIIILKGLVFPWFLKKAAAAADAEENPETRLSGTAAAALYIFIFFISVWLSGKLEFEVRTTPWIIPASFMTIFTGLMTIIARSRTVSQIIGYIIMENGIYIFGLSVFVEQPAMVELAILLDIFVAVFVMGLATFHIGREFRHTDAGSLSELSDWVPEKAGEEGE